MWLTHVAPCLSDVVLRTYPADFGAALSDMLRATCVGPCSGCRRQSVVDKDVDITYDEPSNVRLLFNQPIGDSWEDVGI